MKTKHYLVTVGLAAHDDEMQSGYNRLMTEEEVGELVSNINSNVSFFQLKGKFFKRGEHQSIQPSPGKVPDTYINRNLMTDCTVEEVEIEAL